MSEPRPSTCKISCNANCNVKWSTDFNILYKSSYNNIWITCPGGPHRITLRTLAWSLALDHLSLVLDYFKVTRLSLCTLPWEQALGCLSWKHWVRFWFFSLIQEFIVYIDKVLIIFWAYVMTSTVSSLACPDVITRTRGPSGSRLNSISSFLHCEGIGNDWWAHSYVSVTWSHISLAQTIAETETDVERV